MFEQSKKAKSPALIFEDLLLTHRLIRDQMRHDIMQVWIDSLEIFNRSSQFVSKFMRDLARLMQHYQGDDLSLTCTRLKHKLKKHYRVESI